MFLTNKAGWRKGVALPMSRIGASRLLCFWPAAIRYALSPRQCLAAAIAPRRRKKPARRQFRPLGKAGGVMNPVGLQTRFRRITNHAGAHTDFFRSLERKSDADCGRGRLVPRFRLTSRSAASGDGRWQFCNPPSRANPAAGPYRAYLPARWKGKAYTSAMNVSLKVVGRRSPIEVDCRTAGIIGGPLRAKHLP